MTNFIIDDSLKTYLRPQTVDTNKRLKKSIETEGIRDPLVVGVLPDGERVLVDGHHRYSIIQELGITNYPIVERVFKSLDHIKSYMRDLQLSRRNLTKEERDILIIEENKALEPIKKVVKRFRQSTGSGQKQPKPTTENFYQWAESANLTPKEQTVIKDEFTLKEVLNNTGKRTSEIIANKIGVSPSTVKKVIKMDGSGQKQPKPITNPFWLDVKLFKSHHKGIQEKAISLIPPQEMIDHLSKTLFSFWVQDDMPDLDQYRHIMNLGGYSIMANKLESLDITFTQAARYVNLESKEVNFQDLKEGITITSPEYEEEKRLNEIEKTMNKLRKLVKNEEELVRAMINTK